MQNSSTRIALGSTLRVQSVRVGGNIQSEGHALAHITGRSTVGGGVQLKQGRGAAVTDARINGDLQVESNRGNFEPSRNTIGGNLQANQNAGPLVIRSNRPDSALKCQANGLAPTGGGSNTASSKEDPCARL